MGYLHLAGRYLTILLIFSSSATIYANEECKEKSLLQNQLNNFSSQMPLEPFNDRKKLSEISDSFWKFWLKCEPQLDQQDKYCFKNLVAYMKNYSVTTNPKFGFGLIMPDEEYVKIIEATKPKLFQLPKFFFKNGNLPKDWEERINNCDKYYNKEQCVQVKSWDCIDYENLCDQIGHANQKQVICVIPSDNQDQWVSFRRDMANTKSSDIPVIAITIEKSNPRSSADANKSYFALLENGILKRSADISCIKCHGNGLAKIQPLPGGIITKSGLEKLHKMNAKIASYGRVENPFINQDGRGPMLGKNFGCVKCHNQDGETVSSVAPLWHADPSVSFRMKFHYDMPLALGSKSKILFDALDKVYELPEKERAEFKKFFGGHNCSNTEYMNSDDRTKSLSDALNFLKNKKAISENEYTNALSSLKYSQEIGGRLAREFNKEAETALRQWLQGERNNCLIPQAETPKADVKHIVQ